MSKCTTSAVSLDEASMSAAISKLALAAVTTPDDDDDDDDIYGNDHETMANWSYLYQSSACDGCFCPAEETCPDQVLVRRIVRWVKIIARSKHGMTVVFGLLPLVLGGMVGFYFGRRSWEKQQHIKQQEKGQKSVLTSSSFALGMIGQKFMACLSVIQYWLLNFATMAFTARWCQKEEAEGKELTKGSLVTTEMISKEEDDKRLKFIRDPSKYRESGVELNLVPKHMAFIMDGNRRYGKSKYESVSRGHMDGGYKLRDMVHWCMEECVQEMTVYAFSTENWNRSPAEIDALMSIFCQQCEELRIESKKLQMVVRVLSTDTDPIPDHVKEKLRLLEEETKDCEGSLILNVCLSYGSRGEIVGACQSLAADCQDGKLKADAINEQLVESRLLTRKSPPPDIVLRTSGEVRISNFLLWQCAYSEFFFLSKHWPDLQKEDLIEVIRNYAHGRKRRFGA